MAPKEEKHLNSAQVKRRYADCTDMTLWRWEHDENLGFPKPLIIGSRKYWKLSDLERFEADCARRKMKVPDKHISRRRTVEVA